MFAEILFIASAALTIFGAIAVASTKDIMHACVYLLTCLVGVAGLYLTLSADFVAATQLVVYVGGVVILMVFAVMLTGGASSQRANRFGITKIPMMGNKKTYIFGGLSAVVFLAVLLKILSNVFGHFTAEKQTPEILTNTVEQIGMLLVTDHVLAFEISSVLLLGALIGAAVIARPRHKGE